MKSDQPWHMNDIFEIDFMLMPFQDVGYKVVIVHHVLFRIDVYRLSTCFELLDKAVKVENN